MDTMRECQGCEAKIPKPGPPYCDTCLEWEDFGDGS